MAQLKGTAILYEPPNLLYRIDGRLAERRPLSELQKIIHVYAGNDLDATDIEFDPGYFRAQPCLPMTSPGR